MKNILLLITLLIAMSVSSFGQNLAVNGDFETNKAPHDMINCTNKQFDTLMSDVNAYGYEGNPDIIQSGAYCNGPESNKWYIALTGGGTDAVALTLSTPLIAGNTYALSFWDEGCDFLTFRFEAGISSNDSTTGTIVYEAPECVNGTWSHRVDTFTAPVSGQYLTFVGATGDIGFWGQLDHVVLTSITPPLNSPFVLKKSLCQSEPANVTYTGNGLANDTYTWDFDGANVLSGSGQGPYQLAWKSAGTYYVSLQVADSTGNTSTTTIDTVVVNAPPTSTFIAIPDVEAGKTELINYTGNGDPTTASFAWNFNGATPLNGTGAGPIDVLFKAPGTYDLSLVVTQNGCSSMQTSQQVIVSNPLQVNTPVCTDSICMISYSGVTSVSGNYSWSFSGANVLAGNGEGPYTLQYTTPGTYIVTVTLPTNEGALTFNDTVTVTSGGSCNDTSKNNITSGINSSDGTTASLSVYPNPTLDNLNVNFNTPNSAQVKLEVYDVLGHLVIINNKNVNAGDNSFIVNTSVLSAGSYFIRITGGTTDLSKTQKFIKLL